LGAQTQALHHRHRIDTQIAAAARRAFAEADRDGDGRLSLEEFEVWFKEAVRVHGVGDDGGEQHATIDVPLSLSLAPSPSPSLSLSNTTAALSDGCDATTTPSTQNMTTMTMRDKNAAHASAMRKLHQRTEALLRAKRDAAEAEAEAGEAAAQHTCEAAELVSEPMWRSIWDHYFDSRGCPRKCATQKRVSPGFGLIPCDPPVTVNKMRGATSQQPRKIGIHAYELIDHIWYSRGVKFCGHALEPLRYASSKAAQLALIPDVWTPSDHVPIVADMKFTQWDSRYEPEKGGTD